MRNLPLSAGSVSISQFCLMLKRELTCRRSFLMNGPARFLAMDVGGGGVLLLIVGGDVVTVMLGGVYN